MTIKNFKAELLSWGGNTDSYNRSTRKRALVYMAGPLVTFFLLTLLYVIIYWVFSASYNPATAVTPFVRYLLIAQSLVYSLMVLFAVLWFFSLPAGLVLWFKHPLQKIDPASGLGEQGRLPKGVAAWNWGAAGWPVVWGLANYSWISLIGLIPGVNLIWWIYMGRYGQALAWRTNKWESPEQFAAAQARWKIPGIIGVLINVWGLVFLVVQGIMNLFNL